jgi:glycosyltransferase involved in cell wall biosynthesis
MDESKNVLIITSEFPPQPGGIGNHAYNLALNLQGKYEVTVMADHRDIDEDNEFDKELPFKVVRNARSRTLYYDRFKQAKSLVSINNIIIYSGKFSLWLGGILSRTKGKRHLAVVHGTELLLPGRISKRMIQFSLKRMDRVISVSNYTARQIPYIDDSIVTVIPNGYEIDAECNEEKNFEPHRRLNLVTIGNVTQRKGQHNVINALPNIIERFSNVEYHIVGLPTEKEKFTQLAERLNVSEQVIFHGRCTEQEKIKLLKTSDIFLMLSEQTSTGDFEGFGIAILEANKLGLPAIGSLNCGIEDAIKHGESGLLVDPHDSTSVLKAVESIVANYCTFSENSITWSEKFTWDKVKELYYQVLEP